MRPYGIESIFSIAIIINHWFGLDYEPLTLLFALMRPRVSLGYVLNPFEITELHGRENGKEMNRMREGEIENKGPLGLLIPVAKLGCKQNVTENKNRVCVVCVVCVCVSAISLLEYTFQLLWA